MAKLIIHKHGKDPEEINERRLLENLNLTPKQRWEKMFNLMALSALFKKGPLKKPQGLGVVLTRSK